MPYFHNGAEKILYALPDNPFVIPETYKGRPSGMKISSSMKITYADNPADPKTGSLAKPTNKACVTSYDTRDTKESALQNYFLRWRPDGSIAIDEVEYHRLHTLYSESDSNSS